MAANLSGGSVGLEGAGCLDWGCGGRRKRKPDPFCGSGTMGGQARMVDGVHSHRLNFTARGLDGFLTLMFGYAKPPKTKMAKFKL